jgi:hypothetical protein
MAAIGRVGNTREINRRADRSKPEASLAVVSSMNKKPP